MDSGLFDIEWYAMESGARFDDLAAAVKHYRTVGARLHLSPHPFFDPSVITDNRPGWTAFGTYLHRQPDVEHSPHPAWAMSHHVAAHPEAAGHRHGPLGHFHETLGPGTVVDLDTPDGLAQVRWDQIKVGWQDLASAWASQRRSRRPAWVTKLPPEHRLTDSPPAPETADTLVSVIVPAWNRASVLTRAVESILAQTWQHLEVLVVDDGSEDDTVRVMHDLADRDSRVRVLSRPHEGVSAARNAGIESAEGALIAFLDSDNEWTPDFLESMVRAMHSRALDAAYGTLMHRSSHGVRYRATQVDREALLIANRVDMNALVVRASLLRSIGGFDVSLRRAVDYDLVLSIAERTTLVHVPVVGVVYDGYESASDRLTVREAAAWSDRVRVKHLVDWDALASADRDPDLVSVVLPVNKRGESLMQRLEAVRTALGSTPWEAVVVDSSESRNVLSGLMSTLVTDTRVRYVRLANRSSFSTSADIGCGHAHGARLLFLDLDIVIDAAAIAALLHAAEQQEQSYVLQPVTVDVHGQIISAGAFFTPWSALPSEFLAGHPLGHLEAASDPVIELEALSGRTFTIRAADFIGVQGLDPLLDNELELTDLGMRLARGQEAVQLALATNAVATRTTVSRSDGREPSTREIFVNRHRTAHVSPLEGGAWHRRSPRRLDA